MTGAWGPWHDPLAASWEFSPQSCLAGTDQVFILILETILWFALSPVDRQPAAIVLLLFFNSSIHILKRLGIGYDFIVSFGKRRFNMLNIEYMFPRDSHWEKC